MSGSLGKIGSGGDSAPQIPSGGVQGKGTRSDVKVNESVSNIAKEALKGNATSEMGEPQSISDKTSFPFDIGDGGGKVSKLLKKIDAIKENNEYLKGQCLKTNTTRGEGKQKMRSLLRGIEDGEKKLKKLSKELEKELQSVKSSNPLSSVSEVTPEEQFVESKSDSDAETFAETISESRNSSVSSIDTSRSTSSENLTAPSGKKHEVTSGLAVKSMFQTAINKMCSIWSYVRSSHVPVDVVNLTKENREATCPTLTQRFPFEDGVSFEDKCVFQDSVESYTNHLIAQGILKNEAKKTVKSSLGDKAWVGSNHYRDQAKSYTTYKEFVDNVKPILPNLIIEKVSKFTTDKPEEKPSVGSIMNNAALFIKNRVTSLMGYEVVDEVKVPKSTTTEGTSQTMVRSGAITDQRNCYYSLSDLHKILGNIKTSRSSTTQLDLISERIKEVEGKAAGKGSWKGVHSLESKQVESLEMARGKLKTITDAEPSYRLEAVSDLIKEREDFCIPQFLQLLEAEFKSSSRGENGKFLMVHTSLLHGGGVELLKSGLMKSEQVQVEDMDQIFTKFNGYKISFKEGSEGSSVDQTNKTIYLPASMKPKDFDEAKPIALTTAFFNIPIQGKVSYTTESRSVGADSFMAINKKNLERLYPCTEKGEEKFAGTFAKAEVAKKVSYKVVENLIDKVKSEFGNDCGVGINCFSGKDRTGFALSSLVQWFIGKNLKDGEENIYERSILRSDAMASKVVEMNTGETALKANPMLMPDPLLKVSQLGRVAWMYTGAKITKKVMGLLAPKKALESQEVSRLKEFESAKKGLEQLLVKIRSESTVEKREKLLVFENKELQNAINSCASHFGNKKNLKKEDLTEELYKEIIGNPSQGDSFSYSKQERRVIFDTLRWTVEMGKNSKRDPYLKEQPQGWTKDELLANSKAKEARFKRVEREVQSTPSLKINLDEVLKDKALDGSNRLSEQAKAAKSYLDFNREAKPDLPISIVETVAEIKNSKAEAPQAIARSGPITDPRNGHFSLSDLRKIRAEIEVKSNAGGQIKKVFDRIAATEKNEKNRTSKQTQALWSARSKFADVKMVKTGAFSRGNPNETVGFADGVTVNEKQYPTYKPARLKAVDALIKEREDFCVPQFLQLLEAEFKSSSRGEDGKFLMVQTSLLDGRSKFNESGMMMNEQVQVEDMDQIFEKFNGYNISFKEDSEVSSIDQDKKTIYLPYRMKPEGFDAKKPIALTTAFFNIPIQGDVSYKNKDKDIPTDSFKSINEKNMKRLDAFAGKGANLSSSFYPAILSGETDLSLANDLISSIKDKFGKNCGVGVNL